MNYPPDVEALRQRLQFNHKPCLMCGSEKLAFQSGFIPNEAMRTKHNLPEIMPYTLCQKCFDKHDVDGVERKLIASRYN